jgi:hypothetical protein
MSNRLKFLATGVLALVGLGVLLSACGEHVATTSASCAFIVNDSSTNKTVDKTIYPGQSADLGENGDKKALYFPCNSRTYAINKGNKVNANGKKIGDRFTLAPGITKSGTDIEVAVSAYWTLNENPNVLVPDFYNLCEKYSCWSETPISNNANYADPGWNGMLGENMGESIDRTMRRVTPEFSDTIWQRGTQAEYDKLGELLSKEFDADVREATGYSQDVFCGSGNSGWSDPSKPGHGDFTCTSVRFVVDDVVNANPERQNQANEANGLQSEIEDNEKQLKAARAKYGDQAEFWLGLDDYAETCAHSHCPPVYIPEGVARAGR